MWVDFPSMEPGAWVVHQTNLFDAIADQEPRLGKLEIARMVRALEMLEANAVEIYERRWRTREKWREHRGGIPWQTPVSACTAQPLHITYTEQATRAGADHGDMTLRPGPCRCGLAVGSGVELRSARVRSGPALHRHGGCDPPRGNIPVLRAARTILRGRAEWFCFGP